MTLPNSGILKSLHSLLVSWLAVSPLVFFIWLPVHRHREVIRKSSKQCIFINTLYSRWMRRPRGKMLSTLSGEWPPQTGTYGFSSGFCHYQPWNVERATALPQITQTWKQEVRGLGTKAEAFKLFLPTRFPNKILSGRSKTNKRAFKKTT